MHELRLIHTDLKPENILLVSPEYIKVPDYKVFKDGVFARPECAVKPFKLTSANDNEALAIAA
jgi:serine/threonine protein kinase